MNKRFFYISKAKLIGIILATRFIEKKSTKVNYFLCFNINLLFFKNTSLNFGFKQFKALNFQDQNQSYLHWKGTMLTCKEAILQTYKLHHPSATEYYFLKTNLHLLARSSSKASDHSWASSGEGLHKEVENIKLHCSSFIFVEHLSYLNKISLS